MANQLFRIEDTYYIREAPPREPEYIDGPLILNAGTENFVGGCRIDAIDAMILIPHRHPYFGKYNRATNTYENLIANPYYSSSDRPVYHGKVSDTKVFMISGLFVQPYPILYFLETLTLNITQLSPLEGRDVGLLRTCFNCSNGKLIIFYEESTAVGGTPYVMCVDGLTETVLWDRTFADWIMASSIDSTITAMRKDSEEVVILSFEGAPLTESYDYNSFSLVLPVATVDFLNAETRLLKIDMNIRTSSTAIRRRLVCELSKEGESLLRTVPYAYPSEYSNNVLTTYMPSIFTNTVLREYLGATHSAFSAGEGTYRMAMGSLDILSAINISFSDKERQVLRAIFNTSPFYAASAKADNLINNKLFVMARALVTITDFPANSTFLGGLNLTTNELLEGNFPQWSTLEGHSANKWSTAETFKDGTVIFVPYNNNRIGLYQ